MPLIKFILALRAPEGYVGSPSPTPDWTNWFQRLEANVVDLGHPVIERSTLGNCGTGTVLRGYSLITTDSRESALLLARECRSWRPEAASRWANSGQVPNKTINNTAEEEPK